MWSLYCHDWLVPIVMTGYRYWLLARVQSLLSGLVLYLSGLPITGTSYYFYMVALADWVTNLFPNLQLEKLSGLTRRTLLRYETIGGMWMLCFSYWFSAISPDGCGRRDFKLSRYSLANALTRVFNWLFWGLSLYSGWPIFRAGFYGPIGTFLDLTWILY